MPKSLEYAVETLLYPSGIMKSLRSSALPSRGWLFEVRPLCTAFASPSRWRSSRSPRWAFPWPGSSVARELCGQMASAVPFPPIIVKILDRDERPRESRRQVVLLGRCWG